MAMMEKSDWRYNRYQNAKEEEKFVMSALTIAIGGGTSGGTFEDDTKRHIDIWWDSPKRGVIGLDVKGVKAHSTSAHTFDEGIQWLELMNVKGEDGWLKGEAEYIAFKTFSDVIFVKRQKLLDWTLDHIKGKELVYETPKDYYIPYRRWNSRWQNKDIVCKCPTSDLRKLASWSIPNDWFYKIKDNDMFKRKEI